MTITNDTIIKAAKAAGLTVAEFKVMGENSLFDISRADVSLARAPAFSPLHNDTDNAMIRRGAEIDLEWVPVPLQVEATAFLPVFQSFTVEIGYNDDKGAAEREAVILCAAAKWDAMQGEVK